MSEPRFETNAMDFPSGDQDGSSSFAVPLVNGSVFRVASLEEIQVPALLAEVSGLVLLELKPVDDDRTRLLLLSFSFSFSFSDPEAVGSSGSGSSTTRTTRFPSGDQS
jgi:hypothetical protein